MPGQQQMVKRQRLLGDFGEFALRSEDLDEVLTEACRLVGEALGTARSKILEIQAGGDELLVRAGVGWDANVVGQVRLPMDERSSETFSIREGRPVICRDIREESRFDIPAFMRDAGVVAMINVPIFAPGRIPYGLLQVDADEPREFGQEDIEFLRTYATLLGPVVDRLRKVRTLRATEERFRLIVESVRDYAIFTTDARDRIDGWFSGAQAVFGWTAEEATGRSASITFTPEDREAGADRREIEEARQAGVAANLRWHTRKDGRRVFVEGAVRALRDEAGVVQGFVKVVQDVTARRDADQRLRESEERLAAIFAHAPVGLSEVAPCGRFLRVNSELCRMLGRSERDLLALKTQDVTFGEDIPASLDALERALRDGAVLSLDNRYRLPDGTLVWAQSSFTRLSGGRDGESLLVLTLDLTTRRAADAALRESEARQRALIEGVPQLVWRAKDGGRWTWASPQWAAFTGQPEKNSHDWGWLQCLPQEDRSVAREAWRHAVERGQFAADYRIRAHEDGSYRWFQSRATPMRNEAGEIVEWLGTSTDIEDMRSLQDRQRVLLHELQHRVRNTLAVVRSIAGSTARTSDTVDAFDTHLEGRLNALARTQAVLTRSPSRGVDLDALVRQELQAKAPTDTQFTVSGPEVLLSAKAAEVLALAIHELATNAVKYGALSSPAGAVAVSYACRERRGETWLELTWSESGVLVGTSEPRREGFGTELVTKRVPYELRGSGSLHLQAGGLRAEIAFPLRPSGSMLQTSAPVVA